MILDQLNAMRDLVQEDVGNRGLRADPERNLINALPTTSFTGVCSSLANRALPGLAIVTGFYIPTADPPAGETDGPLGAVFLARALAPLGKRVAIASDAFCVPAINAGLRACDLQDRVLVVTLPSPIEAAAMGQKAYCDWFASVTRGVGVGHLMAIERVGPSHADREDIPPEHRDRCHTMRGIDVTDLMSPAHWLFEDIGRPRKIGIGDGGNEIGMGQIPWDVIRRNIPNGGLIACRILTLYLIVAGVSNWGAYALAAGLYALLNVVPPADLFNPDVERRILEVMVAAGPLVDGVLGRPSVTVDGLSWERYAAVLPQLRELLERP